MKLNRTFNSRCFRCFPNELADGPALMFDRWTITFLSSTFVCLHFCFLFRWASISEKKNVDSKINDLWRTNGLDLHILLLFAGESGVILLCVCVVYIWANSFRSSTKWSSSELLLCGNCLAEHIKIDKSHTFRKIIGKIDAIVHRKCFSHCTFSSFSHCHAAICCCFELKSKRLRTDGPINRCNSNYNCNKYYFMARSNPVCMIVYWLPVRPAFLNAMANTAPTNANSTARFRSAVAAYFLLVVWEPIRWHIALDYWSVFCIVGLSFMGFSHIYYKLVCCTRSFFVVVKQIHSLNAKKNDILTHSHLDRAPHTINTMDQWLIFRNNNEANEEKKQQHKHSHRLRNTSERGRETLTRIRCMYTQKVLIVPWKIQTHYVIVWCRTIAICLSRFGRGDGGGAVLIIGVLGFDAAVFI